jgi:hypothetical protein
MARFWTFSANSPLRGQGFRRAALCIGLAAVSTQVAAPADARITRIEIAAVQSPAFEGASFGTAGRYEKLAGRFFGEVDPNDPLNAPIADIKLAPRNARGMVEYSGAILIIRPVGLERFSIKPTRLSLRPAQL